MAAEAEINVGANAKAFHKTLQGMQAALNEGCTSMTARLARLGQAMNTIGTIGGAVWGTMKTLTGGLSSAAKAVIAPAAAAETILVTFERFTGSATAARELVKQLETYAAKTTFAVKEINDAAAILLAGTRLKGEEIVKMISRLGEFAKASEKPLSEVAALYAKAASVGVTNEILESFSTLKIPVRSILAEIRGVTEAELFDMVSKRQITLEHLNVAIESLTDAGGKFNGVVEGTGQTFEGMVSTLSDGVEICLKEFGMQLLPFLKKTIKALIEAVDKAAPAFKLLGRQIAVAFGNKAGDGLVKIINKIADKIPEIGAHLEYIFAKTEKIVNRIAKVIGKLAGDDEPPQWIKDQAWNNVMAENDKKSPALRIQKSSPLGALKLYQLYQKELERLMRYEESSLERIRDQKIADSRRDAEERAKQAEALEEDEAKQAAARDAAAEEEKKQIEERAEIERAAGRERMLSAERVNNAERERKKLIEENEKRLIAYQERRAKWEQKQADKERERMSIAKQRRELTAEAGRLGVEGPVSPESIRARLDALAAAGAKSHEKEIADLEHLLERWDALTERKKNYVKMRAEAEGNLRADALEAAGRHQAAARLREEMETARRIEELKNAGFSARRAADIATAESTMRRYKSITEKIQNARVEFIQGHQAAEGGGGVSLRVGGATLEQVKEQTRLQKEMRNLLQRVANRNSSTSSIAVLA